MKWHRLDTELPELDVYAVILFPLRGDGVLYAVSNPHYARSAAARQAGYTHWAYFDLAPTHREWVEWQDGMQKFEYERQFEE